MTITTKSGFCFELDPKTLDDIEMLDIIYEFDDGNMRHLSAFCQKLLGDDFERLRDHVRTEDGRVPISALMAEITDIIHASPDAKK